MVRKFDPRRQIGRLLGACRAQPYSIYITIDNIQNSSLEDLTGSGEFEKVMQGLKGLHLTVAHEGNCVHDQAKADLFRSERQNFEPHLSHGWLNPIAKQLTSLSLEFHCGWKVMPGKLNTSDLNFPNLKNLHLGGLYHSSQKTLQTLCLDWCAIASHLLFSNGHRQLWDVQDTDWIKHPREALGFNGEGDEVYTFEGTWADVFHAIRESLPNLLDFEFVRSGDIFFGRHPDLTEIEELHLGRYLSFDTGYCYGWFHEESNMAFGNNHTR
ncbi:unnamed protein product [Clonostachys rosea]|uniref:TauD/TfdA-like domain-containing protein n=1 Tax=Bionectria ochroleuca TaxID=29856 RepID=A0ABY6UDA5_BIOOC|nr:unnamed protein product [Clonostachys rosea]